MRLGAYMVHQKVGRESLRRVAVAAVVRSRHPTLAYHASFQHCFGKAALFDLLRQLALQGLAAESSQADYQWVKTSAQGAELGAE